MMESKAFPEKIGGFLAGRMFRFCCSTSRELSSACLVCKFISCLNGS